VGLQAVKTTGSVGVPFNEPSLGLAVVGPLKTSRLSQQNSELNAVKVNRNACPPDEGVKVWIKFSEFP
jgi:hypothetical protein